MNTYTPTEPDAVPSPTYTPTEPTPTPSPEASNTLVTFAIVAAIVYFFVLKRNR
jgi:hypothetical protein